MSVQSHIIPTLLGAVTLSLGVAAAHAGEVTQDGVTITYRTVKYADLDLSRQQDARELYMRLKVAAERVCSNGEPALALKVRAMERDCAEAALTDAVRKVGHPALAALHDASPTRIAQNARNAQRT